MYARRLCILFSLKYGLHAMLTILIDTPLIEIISSENLLLSQNSLSSEFLIFKSCEILWVKSLADDLFMNQDYENFQVYRLQRRYQMQE